MEIFIDRPVLVRRWTAEQPHEKKVGFSAPVRSVSFFFRSSVYFEHLSFAAKRVLLLFYIAGHPPNTLSWTRLSILSFLFVGRKRHIVLHLLLPFDFLSQFRFLSVAGPFGFFLHVKARLLPNNGFGFGTGF